MDIYQGKIGTISPAFGNYDLQTYLNIDKGAVGLTGIGATGIQGTGSLTLTNWAQGITGIAEWAQGITGINPVIPNNLKHGYYA